MLNHSLTLRLGRLPDPMRFGHCAPLPAFSRLVAITGVKGAPVEKLSMLFSCHPPTAVCKRPCALVKTFLPCPNGKLYDQLNTAVWRTSKSELPRFVVLKVYGFCGATRFEVPLELSILWP